MPGGTGGPRDGTGRGGEVEKGRSSRRRRPHITFEAPPARFRAVRGAVVTAKKSTNGRTPIPRGLRSAPADQEETVEVLCRLPVLRLSTGEGPPREAVALGTRIGRAFTARVECSEGEGGGARHALVKVRSGQGPRLAIRYMARRVRAGALCPYMHTND